LSKSCQKSYQKIVKKLSNIGQKVAKKLPKSCHKIVKKLSKSYQKMKKLKIGSKKTKILKRVGEEEGGGGEGDL
jgi:hypothetical protein